MKKFLSFLLMVFTASVGLLAVTTQNVYANPVYPLSLTGQDQSITDIYLQANGSTYDTYKIMIDSQVYDFNVYLDDWATSFTNPNVGYAIEIKANTSSLALPSHPGVKSVIINFTGSSFEIYFDGVRYPGASNQMQSYMADWAQDYSSVNPILDNAIHFAIDARPTISGEENFATSVNDLRPLSFFQGFLYAFDETDGDLTDSIVVVTDNYTANMSVLGRYEVTFAVEDSAGNRTELIAYINVVDITAPIISGNTNVAEVSYTQTYNIQTFRSTLTITDNYHNLTNSNIVVETDNYTANKTVPGTYSIVFSATDPSGNKTTFTKQVKVIDDIAPVFSGTTLITKPSNSILTVANIQSQLSAVDAIEGNKTAQITVQSDGFTGNGNRVGSYDIVFQVQDSKGNKSTHTVRVNVVDNIAPIIYIKDNVSIVLKANEVLTREQIIQILQVTEQIQSVNQTTVFSFDIDEYSGNENTVGLYMMSVRVSNVSGNESVHNMMINVVEGDTEDDITVEEPHFEWYEHVWNFIVAVFNFVIDVFVNIWNFIVGIWNWVVGLFQAEEVAFAYFIRRY